MLSMNEQEIPSNILMYDDSSRSQSIETLHHIPCIDVIKNSHDIQTRFGSNETNGMFNLFSMCAISRKECVLAVTECAKHRLISTDQLYVGVYHDEEICSFPLCFQHKDLSVGSSHRNDSMFCFYHFGIRYCPSTSIGSFRSLVLNALTVSTGSCTITPLPSLGRTLEAENEDFSEFVFVDIDSVERRHTYHDESVEGVLMSEIFDGMEGMSSDLYSFIPSRHCMHFRTRNCQ